MRIAFFKVHCNEILDDYTIHLQLFITQLDVELFTVKLDVARSMVLEKLKRKNCMMKKLKKLKVKKKEMAQ